MRGITDFRKIQTFYTKYRPNKDPFWSKGLYYRPRSLNKDPGGSTDSGSIAPGYLQSALHTFQEDPPNG